MKVTLTVKVPTTEQIFFTTCSGAFRIEFYTCIQCSCRSVLRPTSCGRISAVTAFWVPRVLSSVTPCGIHASRFGRVLLEDRLCLGADDFKRRVLSACVMWENHDIAYTMPLPACCFLYSNFMLPTILQAGVMGATPAQNIEQTVLSILSVVHCPFDALDVAVCSPDAGAM